MGNPQIRLLLETKMSMLSSLVLTVSHSLSDLRGNCISLAGTYSLCVIWESFLFLPFSLVTSYQVTGDRLSLSTKFALCLSSLVVLDVCSSGHLPTTAGCKGWSPGCLSWMSSHHPRPEISGVAGSSPCGLQTPVLWVRLRQGPLQRVVLTL